MEIGSSVSQRNSVAYLNGRVFTVNKDQPWASAFIVSETGIFETVGTDQEIQAIASKRGLVQFDLQKKFIMPGIHDAHSHMYSACMQKLNEATISLEPNDDKIAEKLMEGNCMCSFQGVYGDWIIGNQYISFQFPGGVPDRRHLDHLFPDRPVLIRELSAHKLLLNTAGLKRLGIDDSVSNPPGGFFLRRPDGTLSGEVMETAMERVWYHLEKLLEAFDAKGMTCKLHATGEGSVRVALNAIEKVRRRNPEGPRHEIAHCNAVHNGKL
ncbi:hypothetical protein NW754_001453 [Fusarium falciforme]|nr:hypothetical protein NW754_001453 [Fusarium falciforme]